MRLKRNTLRAVSALILALILTILSIPSPAMAAGQGTAAAGKKDLMILYTSDVHCGIDQGFGYDGLAHVKEEFEKKGYNVILVDGGDSIQGEALGMLTKGDAIIDLMNDVGYEIAIPGNHEFDYGMDVFLDLAKKADFPYISCNFTYKDKPVFDPYIIKEFDGIRVGFVGVTTPESLTTSTPSSFMDEDGNYVYGFCADKNGTKLYRAVQKAADDARADGADYIVVMGHMGNDEKSSPYTYADVISNTNGIDIFLDGHSHDTEQVVMKNKDGEDVIRSACGTKLACIGWAKITQDGKKDAGIYTWANTVTPASLFGFENDITKAVEAHKAEFADFLNVEVGETEVLLTINDPSELDSKGLPVRMVRRAETNLGDLVTDAFLARTGADIAIVNGGGVRTNIEKGVITRESILKVQPFGKSIVVIEATGQQILDALEWGARNVPDECGGFLQTAGLSYEIHSYIDSGCTSDDEGMFTGVEGERRVRNVMAGGEELDPDKVYTVASSSYIMMEQGDGYTQFNGCEIVSTDAAVDYQILLDYITEDLGGKVGREYADLDGDGRIVIVEEAPEDGDTGSEKKDAGKSEGKKTSASGSAALNPDAVPIASAEYAETAAEALGGYLGAFQKFDTQKMLDYTQEQGIDSLESDEFFQALQDPSLFFGTEDMPEGSVESLMNMMSYALDYDYEIEENRKEGDDVWLDVTLITYDFTSVSDDFLTDFLAKVMAMYLEDPDTDEDAAVSAMLESLSGALSKLDERTERSTDEVRCWLEDGIWYAELSEDFMDKLLGNFEEMFDNF